MLDKKETEETLPGETKIESDSGKEYTVAEIQHSNRIQKSTTPKGDLSWYIKWFGSIASLLAVSFRSAGIPELHMADMTLSWIGAIAWTVVGFMWKDRALVLLNGVVGIMLFAGILRILYG